MTEEHEEGGFGIEIGGDEVTGVTVSGCDMREAKEDIAIRVDEIREQMVTRTGEQMKTVAEQRIDAIMGENTDNGEKDISEMSAEEVIEELDPPDFSIGFGSNSRTVDVFDPDEDIEDPGPGEAMAPDPETASEINDYVGDGEIDSREWVLDGSTKETPAMDPTPGGPTFETLTIDIDEDAAETLIGVVMREKYEAENEGFDASTLVLGVEQYAKLEVWCQAKHGHPIDHRLPFARIVTVPGPMVHVARPNKHTLFEHYEGD